MTHPIYPFFKSINLLGFRVFYYHKLLRKRNIKNFTQKLEKLEVELKENLISYEKVMESVNGWFAYAKWGNTYELRKKILYYIFNNFKD